VTKTARAFSVSFRVFLVIVLVLSSFLVAFFSGTANAQTLSKYYVTIQPNIPHSQIYTTIGSNWTISFKAQWSYGEDTGKTIENGTLSVEVKDHRQMVIVELPVNATDGLFSFNYSSAIADILTFTPTKLITEDGKEWSEELIENNLTGLQGEPITVWWDTFQTWLIDYSTDETGAAMVVVNVTYLLIPENGLTLPEWATYSHQTFLPKTIHNANVTINGIKAQETSSPGIFETQLPIWLPTAYVLVEVTQEGWKTTRTAFSFPHHANLPFWQYATILGSILIMATIATILILKRKSRDNKNSHNKKNYAFVGGIFLAVTSAISLYWGIAGLEGWLHGFDWQFLAIMGLSSFGFGLTASALSIRRKHQAIVLSAVIFPMLTNLVAVKSSLDVYNLTNPVLFLLISLGLSIVTGLLVSNADEAFTQN
jgi:hypothetical protein